MPSPILHCAAGAAIYGLGRRFLEPRRGRLAALIVVAALLPDIDFLPGLIQGDPNRFHNGPTHSVFFAFLVAAMMTWLALRKFDCSRTQRWMFFIFTFLAGVSHSMLDGLCVDERAPFGVPIFWPVWDVRFHVANAWFDGIKHGASGVTPAEFFDAVFSVANVKTMAKEFGIGAVAMVLGWWIGRPRRSGIETK